MSFAHLTLPTRDVERTAKFFADTLGYRPNPSPANSPIDTVWLDLGGGREIHIVYVDGFAVSAFEGEFGRHVAVYFPREEFPALRQRLLDAGAQILEPLRSTPFERLFFRDPVNGYVFEVIDQARRATV